MYSNPVPPVPHWQPLYYGTAAGAGKGATLAMREESPIPNFRLGKSLKVHHYDPQDTREKVLLAVASCQWQDHFTRGLAC